MAASISRKNKLYSGYKCNEKGSNSDYGSPCKSKKRKKIRGDGVSGELAVFGEALKESDLARTDLERE